MILYPAIDLRGGRVVRLTEGRFDQERVHGDDPVAVARGFAAAGARWLHLVDLDGARDPSGRQTELVERIVGSCGLSVQTGGGLRTTGQLEAAFRAGAERVVIGSVALAAPELVRAWLERFGPERIVLAADVRYDGDGVPRVAGSGWQDLTRTTLDELLARFVAFGLVHLLCTDIARDGTCGGPNTELYARLLRDFPGLLVQASGGVASLDDLRGVRSAGVAGVVVGRALYERRFTLGEALAC
jgi:phosphoribosylformimino-5-aminoimidazole carboxamide ribotide isomerase